MGDQFDVVFVADPRFPGGTSTALAAELNSARRAKLRAALLPIKGAVLRRCWPFHAEVAAHLDSGEIRLIEPGHPVSARVAIIHHPMLFEQPPVEHLEVEASHVVLVLHHPPRNGLGEVEYALEPIVRHIEMAFARVPWLAPVGPVVRRQLEGNVLPAPLLPNDWYNLIDVTEWPERPPYLLHSPVHIGRHSRPHPPKWPDTREVAMAAWPSRGDIKVSMLGAGDFLARLYGSVPPHWELRPFQSQDVQAYLAELDFYVYFHSERWVEAFGRSILEALATGLVCILPRHFEPLFGAAAVYGEPSEVSQIIDEFIGDPARFAMQSRRARRYVESHFGPARFIEQLAVVDNTWFGHHHEQPPRQTLPAERANHTVLFFSSNGVGLGHLTRQLAIAEAFGPDITPVFFTLSQGMGLAAKAGFDAEYHPFHRATNANVRSWNDALAEELGHAIGFYRPQVIVFDGNMPYAGLIEAMQKFRAIKSVWIRRGFWAHHHAEALARARHFDAIIEPGDLAEAFDDGPTRSARDTPFATPPIVRVPRAEILTRAAARQSLGLRLDSTVAALSLGSGSNFDLSGIRQRLIRDLGSRAGVEIVEIVSPISAELPAAAPGVRQITIYPVLPAMAAFDFMIATCGYNTFHETMLTGMPTIFVPNEAEEMDLQLRRAQYGEIAGANLVLRASNPHQTSAVLDKVLSPDVRARLSRRALGLWRENGAQVAARFISDYARLRKTGSLEQEPASSEV